MSQILKFYFGSEIRRTRIPSDKLSFDLLVQKVQELFPQLGNQKFSFSYVDEDSDKITVDRDEEVLEAVRSVGGSVLKLNIEPKYRTEGHRGIFCDGCGVQNPEGCRYKCLNCEDFDLCEKCEGNKEIRQLHDQSHIFLRISHPVVLLPAYRFLSDTFPTTQTCPQEHQGVTCDNCDKKMVGIRYKCAVCCNYDLCESCIEKSSLFHPTQHPFIKLVSPVPFHSLIGAQMYEARDRVLLPVPALKGCPFRRMGGGGGGCPRRFRGMKHCGKHRHQQQEKSENTTQATLTPTPTETSQPLSSETQQQSIQTPSSSESEGEEITNEETPLLSTSSAQKEQKVVRFADDLVLIGDDSWAHEWEPLVTPLHSTNVEEPKEQITQLETPQQKQEDTVTATPSEVQQNTTPQPQEKKDTPYQSQLEVLEGMGFLDGDRNLACLLRHKGNLEAAVNELLGL